MDAYLWKDTPFEAFVAEIDAIPQLYNAYCMGKTEQLVAHLFAGQVSGKDARNVARIMMHSYAGKIASDIAAGECLAIANAWRERKGLN